MSVACSSVISRGTNLLRAGRGNYFLPSKLSEINYTVELKKTFSMYNHLRGKRRDYFEEKSFRISGHRALDKSIAGPKIS